MTAYKIQDYKTYKVDDDDQLVPLANFTAEIVKETRTIDGLSSSTTLTIKGQQKSKKPPENGVEEKPVTLPEVTIDAGEFTTFQWVLRAWGSRCVIYPGGSAKDDLRTAIQLTSHPAVSEIFGTMGWQEDAKGEKMFLHSGGAIKSDGNDPKVTVVLPPELKRFNLNDGEPGCDDVEAFLTSLECIKLGPPEIMWPLWASTYATILGPCDFAVHLTGRSGTYKSEVTSLFQAHYGGSIDARHLPASWSSTANALEAQAYFAANAVMVLDDFVPTGTSYQQKSYQTTADRLIRGQGNQAGRARLSDAASFKSAYYPRGLIMSTGEDTPEGHSIRARMLILELSPGDIDVATLTKLQAKRKQMTVAMTAFVKDACDTVSPEISKNGQLMTPELQQRVNEVRDILIQIGHSRTPPMLARLIATVETVLQWAAERGLIDDKKAGELNEQANEAIVTAGQKQASYLESADPVAILLNAIRTALSSQKGHIRSMSGGVPTRAEQLGWTTINATGEMTKYKAGGSTIGWIDRDDDTIYLEADLAFSAAKKEAGNELSITKPTAWKRLKDAGMLKRTDASRSRNTIRVTADGHTRNVIALAIGDLFDSKEEIDGDAEHHDEEQG
jgi:hypothetical protein